MGKRGPRRIAGKRQPNGQLNRRDAQIRKIDGMGTAELEVLAVGLDARMRVHGIRQGWADRMTRGAGKVVTLEQVLRDQKAATVIGRWHLRGEISQAQYDAAVKYVEHCRDYSIVMFSPRQPGAVNPNAVRGGSGDYENTARTAHVKACYDGARRVVQDAQNQLKANANLFGALNLVVLDDKPLPHLLGDVRVGLNSLVRHYGIVVGERRVKQAEEVA